MKKILMVAVVAAFAVSFVACNKKAETTPETAPSTTSEIEVQGEVVATPTDTVVAIEAQEVPAPAAQ